MPDGKADNQLNLALDVSEQTREKTLDLNVGYTPETNTWELIVKYSGNISRIADELDLIVVPLQNEYAIITIREDLISLLSNYEEIEFIEKPKRIFYTAGNGRTASCINPLQTPLYNLFGRGVIVAVIDSGIDYSHPDFRNENGTTRIIDLWDQTIPGTPPLGYAIGTLYTREQLNEALLVTNPIERQALIPSVDLSGHGTHVKCLNTKMFYLKVKKDIRNPLLLLDRVYTDIHNLLLLLAHNLLRSFAAISVRALTPSKTSKSPASLAGDLLVMLKSPMNNYLLILFFIFFSHFNKIDKLIDNLMI